MIDLARSIFELATQSKEQGIANYMADLQDMYSKKAWMMRSVLKKDRG